MTPLVLADEDKDEVYAEVLAAFNSAKGIFRKKAAQDIKLRHTPELIFKIDSSMDYGRHIDSLLETLTYGEEAAEEAGEDAEE